MQYVYSETCVEIKHPVRQVSPEQGPLVAGSVVERFLPVTGVFLKGSLKTSFTVLQIDFFYATPAIV